MARADLVGCWSVFRYEKSPGELGLISLYCHEGLTQEEIGGKLEITKRTVSSRMRAIDRKLAAYMK